MLIDRFEQVVSCFPNRIAVRTVENELSYQELCHRANLLADMIVGSCCASGDTQTNKTTQNRRIAALLFEHGSDMIVGAIGSIKADTIYVPLDQSYPIIRLAYMLQDSGADFLVTNDRNINLASDVIREAGSSIQILNISNFSIANSIENIIPKQNDNDVAYILYTSGSTGKPKGVIQSYKNLLHYVECYSNAFSISEDDRMTLFSSYSHDGSLQDTYGALLNGATLYPLNIRTQTSISELAGWLKKEQITIWHSVPTLYRYFLNTITKEDKFPNLRFVTVGGENVMLNDVQSFQQVFARTDTKFSILYGQSESSLNTIQIYSAVSEVKKVTLGKPIEKTNIVIANREGEEVDPLKEGEIVVLSDYVALGYWNDEIKGKESFIKIPEIGRAYRTGDLGRLLLDGSVEFLGRIDQQVKIRGLRIELGEIENLLLKMDIIKEAIVLAWENKNREKYLCAYIVLEEVAEEIVVNDIRTYLLERLPDYMVPAFFVFLDSVPLSPNGKVDRKALIEPTGRTGRSYEAPRNKTEEVVAKIWSEVLGIEKIGINESFFELGGHSLKGTVVVSRIQKELNAEFPLRELFKTPTVAGISEYLKKAKLSKYSSIEVIEEKEAYKVSSAQKRMYILQQFDTDGINYNMPVSLIAEGLLDMDRLNTAIHILVSRHEILRTSFEAIGDSIVQRIHKSVPFSLEYTGISDCSIDEIIKEFVRPFELNKVPLLRVGLVKLEEEKHLLLFDVHHIISDGISLSILTRELMELYKGKNLGKQRIQYKDFSEWQSSYLRSDKIYKQEKYWLEKFAGELTVLDMPLDYDRPAIQEFSGQRMEFCIGRELYREIKTIAKETGTTTYMILLSAVSILLSKYSGQEDIIIGSPIAGRPHVDLENMLGVFINTLAMRNYPESQKTFSEFLAEVKDNALEAYENQEYQFEELINKLDLCRDLSRNPLFDVMFSMQNLDLSELKLEGLAFTRYESNEKATKVDLEFTAIELDEEIRINIGYCTSLYSKETIDRLSEHLCNLLRVITKDRNIYLGEIDILSRFELNRVLYEFNNTNASYPQEKTIHQLFEEQVQRIPNNVALVFDGNNMTYNELNNKANQLARVLRDKGVQPDCVVGIMVERSFEMLVGILGIFKAGGAYLPIDPEYPENRIEFILEDSETKILLSQSWLKTPIAFDGEVIRLDDYTIYERDHSNLKVVNQAEDLAYVIYTSGSSGNPKGVMVEHKSVMNLLYDMQAQYPLNTNDAYLLKTIYTFDVSVPELFGWIVSGERLIILQQGHEAIPKEIIKMIIKENITHIYFVPSALNIFLDEAGNCSSKDLMSLKYVFTIGEVLKQETIYAFYNYFSTAKLENVYGPTEATVYNSRYTTNVHNIIRSIPIGKPIRNVRLYIVDDNIKPQPLGVKGELCIGGVCLARGYLKQPGLTAEKFISNPFIPGERIYRTGDLARWLPDGNIEFIGRKDDQIKIRGFRIEPGEIEHHLLEIGFVKEAIVLVKADEHGDKFLCAYLVTKGRISVGELREHLSNRLPDYMIPSFFMQLDSLPLTKNGKVDRKALPQPEGGSGVAYVAPRNKTEAVVEKIWSEVLGIKKIGIDDNFFELGGHSLKGTVVISRIQKELNAEFPLRELFKTPTVAGISEYLKKAKLSRYASIEAVEVRAVYKASSAQKRMYILQQFNSYSTNYNIPVTMILEGVLNRNKLGNAIHMLVKRHEILRTSFETIVDSIIQRIHTSVPFSLEYTEISDCSIDEIIKGFGRPFELDKVPLLRVGLVKLEEEKHLLLFDIHHIISDGISLSILIRELVELYKGKNLGKQRIQYKDYSEWQSIYLGSDEIYKQEKYWLERFSGELPVLNMPLDYERPAIQEFSGRRMEFCIGRELYREIKTIAKETGTTTYMILLSAISILLSKYSGQEDIIIGSPIAGRSHVDLENMLGVFVNTLAMRNYPESRKTYTEFLYEVKENALEAYENQEYQFEELINKLDLCRDLSRNPLFDVMFSMQNLDVSVLELEGLTFTKYESSEKAVKVDLEIVAIELDREIKISIGYCTSLFSKETIERLGEHLFNLLKVITRDRTIYLGEIDILSEYELNRILYEFNNTNAYYPQEKTIHQLFEEQVLRTPNSVALVLDDKIMTYDVLNARANQLARTLRINGVKPGSVVGIMVEHSFETFIGILGILKSGGAYLPIDSIYPKERIGLMLEDAKVRVLLTQSKLIETTLTGFSILELDNNKAYSGDSNNLNSVNSTDDLVYVIYTSGSTGSPKGVKVQHKNLSNYIWWAIKKYFTTDCESMPLFTSIAFDLTVTTLFAPIVSGNRIVIYNDNDDEFVLNRIIRENKATLIKLTPSHLTMVKGTDFSTSNIKKLIVGGENFKVKLAKEISSRFENIEIYNEYGPTETVVGCMIYKYNEEKDKGASVPIGHPIDNMRIFVMNRDLKIVPTNVVGEIYTSGIGISQGYINSPELTSEKYIINPYVPGELMYKTGDLARRLSDGNIEFLGRVDDQVKIRGFRVELSEIEGHLISMDEVKEVVISVDADDNGDKYLCAYIVSEEDVSTQGFRERLSEKLPDYMIPSYFIQIDTMPLNPNGKIDRKLLPAPKHARIAGFDLPENKTEDVIIKIWSEVLGLSNIGIHDNFFELGGHSLKASIIVSRIQKELNIELPLKQLFKTPTVAGINNYLKKAIISEYASIVAIAEKDIYNVSAAQKRMYLLHQIDTSGTGYNIPVIITITGSLKKNSLEDAVKKLVNRNEVLRTSFEVLNDKIVQRIHKEIDLPIEYSENTNGDIEEVVGDFIRPFDLNKAPLLRIGLVKISEDMHVLLFDIHHIISDGISMSILAKEFSELYNGKELKKQRIQYKDFSEWQNDFLKSNKMQDQEKYWLEKFSNGIPVLNMPLDYSRPVMQDFCGQIVEINMGKELSSKIKIGMQETSTTLYMIILSAVNVLLYKYTGQEDIIIGSPIAARPHVEIEKMLGVFINTLVMRNYPKPDKTYREFLYEIRDNALCAFENQDYQFEELVEKLDLRRDLSRNPMFDIMVSLQNVDVTKIELEGLSLLEYAPNKKTAKFDIEFIAKEVDEEIHVNIVFCSSLFKRETVERMGCHLKRILEVIIDDMGIYLGRIDILPEFERNQILYGFNDTYTDYPKDKTIHQLFEEQAERTPDGVALVFMRERITYRELNSKTNQLARTLIVRGVKHGSLVGIMVERSFDMLIGILGILKAGGAYVPIDPSYPTERIRFILEDSQTNILLTHSCLKSKIKSDCELLELDGCELYTSDHQNLELESCSNDLAYVTYTSGSTGKPKGIMVEHGTVVNLLYDMETYYPLGKNDAYLLKTTYTFDVSIPELFGWIIPGEKLVILPPEYETKFAELIDIIFIEKITHVYFVPSTLCAFLDEVENHSEEKLRTLKFVFTIGEVLKQETVRNFYDYLKTATLENLYGPTEATVYNSRYTTDISDDRPNVLIGKPIRNVKLYIANNNLEPQPIGIVGEVCIGGLCLARGYLNNPDLTMEKFIDNPFIPNELMYRTGDLARWLPDGNIEFFGRVDRQVKIRGLRIELEEIENKLLEINLVKNVLVIAVEESNSEKLLCAYYVSIKELSIKRFREWLSESLPDYMIPTLYVRLDTMPLNSNGKIDYRSLPAPEKIIGNNYVAPRNNTEETIVKIWADVLDIKTIGIHDNFFKIGGHSLKGAIVASRIHKELNVELPLRELFKAQTISGISKYLENAEKSVCKSIEAIGKAEVYEASSAQSRMFILQRLNPDSTSYNLPVILTLEGTLEKNKIDVAIKKLINRHEVLRTSFEMVDGNVVQRIHEDVGFTISYLDEVDIDVDDKIKSFIQPFDLRTPTLLRVGIIRQAEEKYVLLFDTHHIISDGISIAVLTKEFSRLYHGQELEAQRIQYKDFAKWQNDYLRSDYMNQQKDYWLGRFSGEIPLLNIPLDYQRPVLREFKGQNMRFSIGCELSRKLKTLSSETGTTLYMILLSAINILLSKYTNQEDIIIGSPVAGRPHADLENVLGLFVNTLAMRNHPRANISYSKFLSEVKENTLRAFENQFYQFEELIAELDLNRDLSRNPLFDVMFTMQNTDANKSIFENIRSTEYIIGERMAKFDLEFATFEEDDDIKIVIGYCTALFREETIERLGNHFCNVLKAIAEDVSICLGEIDVLSKSERYQILCEFNDTDAFYPQEKTVQQLFEERVEIAPDSTALVFNKFSMTYSNLNKKANQLARLLRDKGLRPNDLVGIMVEPSFEMIIGILGILKAGGAYLPIDIGYPKERIRFMLKDSGTKVLLTQSRYYDQTIFSGNILNIDNYTELNGNDANLISVNDANDVVYVIYTSGSTGAPKGVVIEHKSVVNYCFGQINKLRISNKDRMILTSTITFDMSVEQIFTTLLGGAALYLVDKNVLLDRRLIVKFMFENCISYLHSVPSLLERLDLAGLNCLRIIFSGGELFTTNLAKKLIQSGNWELYNSYGPTEATIISTVYSVETNETKAKIPIGKPLQNTQIYILDKSQKLSPIGVQGEVFIGGEGLARGYFNQPELTSEKFLINPHLPGHHVFYRTGDLARWLPDGNIEFVGRIDNQVKIRGLRIELGEIENQLLKISTVKEVVVLAREDELGDKYLCAYIVSVENMSTKEFREILSHSLPRYMIPTHFIHMDDMPLNLNGKIDTKSLPIPESTRETDYELPRNDMEEIVARIWSEVLGLEKIGIHDNFFEIGGHSLKASDMALRIHRELDIEVPLREVFKLATIASLTGYLASAMKSKHTSIIAAEDKEVYSVSSAQKRMYTLQELDPNGTSYNISKILTLEGSFDRDVFQQAICLLIKKHEILRTSFEVRDESIIQLIHNEIGFTLEYSEKMDEYQRCSQFSPSQEAEKSTRKANAFIDEEIKRFIRPFNLSTPPLLRVGVVRLTEGKHLILLDIHHIVSDGTSLSIMTKELLSFYKSLKEETSR